MKFQHLTTIMLSSIFTRQAGAFAFRNQARSASTRAFGAASLLEAKAGQAEVILVGCGAPNRGMGWYHAIQMLEEK
jgi:hypothetical protein